MPRSDDYFDRFNVQNTTQIDYFQYYTSETGNYVSLAKTALCNRENTFCDEETAQIIVSTL